MTADLSRAAGNDPVEALADLASALAIACDDLFAAVPFPGDQSTGHDLNRYIDNLVDALRMVAAEADDLQRAMVVTRQRRERAD